MSNDARIATRLREGIERVRAPQPNISDVRDRARRVRVARLAAGAVGAVLIALAVGLPLALLAPLGGHHERRAPAGSTTNAVPEGFLGYLPPTFADANGWNTESTGPIGIDDETLPVTWAANVPFDPKDLESPVGTVTSRPDQTILGMSEDGVVIVAALWPGAAEGNNVNFPDRTLPLSLSDFERGDGWEGQIADNVPEWTSLSRVSGQYLEVRIYFATLRPSDATQATAQEELDRLEVPQLPPVPPATGDLYPSGRKEWVTHVDSQDHVSVSMLQGWTFRSDPVPKLLDPPILFAAGTWPLPVGGDCSPYDAVQEMSSFDALFWVWEYGPERVRDPADFPPRQELGDRIDLGEPQGPLECIGRKAYVIRFLDDGRYFVVNAVLGADATVGERETLIDEISSIQAGDGVNCGVTSADPLDGRAFSLEHGAPGEEVTVAGPTLRGEDGRYASADRVEVWWGTGAEAMRVGETDVSDRCAFVASFQVPDVGSGTYPVEVRIYHDGGFGLLGKTDFSVP
jgi:hypothetical protein